MRWMVWLGLAVVWVALTWEPGRADGDDLRVVENPQIPAQGRVTLDLEPLWRLDGDDESLLLGLISDVAVDADGNVYLLDSQLHEVQVIAPDGAFLRTIGRQGEGPGEFDRPQGVVVLPDGRIGVVQPRPGKLVLLTPEGEPAGEIAAPMISGGTPRLSDVQVAGGHILFRATGNEMKETGVAVAMRIVEMSPSGEVLRTPFEMSYDIEFSAALVEGKVRGIRRWRLLATGDIVVQRRFDAYQLTMYPVSGEAFHFGRDYPVHRRTAEELEEAKSRMFVGGGIQVEIEVSPTDPAVIRSYPRTDGTLWVLSGDGAYRNPEGTLGTWDVFDGEGRFLRQVTLGGDGDYRTDGYFFIGDDRLVVVEEVTGATRAAMAAAGQEYDENEEVEPLSVACYRIPRIE